MKNNLLLRVQLLVRFGMGPKKAMCARKNSASHGLRLLFLALCCTLLCGGVPQAWAAGRRGAGFQAHAHAATPPAHAAMPQASAPQGHAGMPARQGQQHLPQWWASHRNLPPNQQAEALRREPGFRNLPEGQQQRLLNRLQSFNQRSPQQQQRTLGRVEMFERLSPERQQEVRGASQAFSHMAPDRQVAMRHAFQQLRQMPPEQRQQMLNSSYGSQFSPQERTVLGNMLSIEPYQPHIVQPYFGR